MTDIKFNNLTENSSYTVTYLNDTNTRDEGCKCGDGFFNRGGKVLQDIQLKVTSLPENSKESILDNKDLIKVLSKLDDLYTFENDIFTCKTRMAYIFIVRVIRLTTRKMGREILAYSLYLNTNKKYNIYKALYSATSFLKYKYNKTNTKTCYNTILLPDYTISYLTNTYLKQNCIKIAKLNRLNWYIYFKRNINLKKYYLKLILNQELDRENNGVYNITNNVIPSNYSPIKRIKAYMVFYVYQHGRLSIEEKDLEKIIILNNKIDLLKWNINNNDCFDEYNKLYSNIQKVFEKYATIKLTDLDNIT